MAQTVHERRRFWRAAFNAPVNLTGDKFGIDATLDDISLKGALLECPEGWRGTVGERCHLTLLLGGEPSAKIVMEGHIAHIEGRRVGLNCDSIDLDSITHLRRLVELNAGDPELLDRELVILLGG
ncbi:MAG: PilZ domain-containing protein [Methylococcaceae bacterium]|nr:PilZ domain-containing protein [Methylococcaceae bacterium]